MTKNIIPKKIQYIWKRYFQMQICEQTEFTPISIRASVRASSVWGTCKFISSPSKSALYGLQTDSLNRRVLHGIILAYKNKKTEAIRNTKMLGKLKHKCPLKYNEVNNRVTLWDMIDIRCKLGCLLKRTMSPLSKWRSTTYPYFSSSATRFLFP